MIHIKFFQSMNVRKAIKCSGPHISGPFAGDLIDCQMVMNDLCYSLKLSRYILRLTTLTVVIKVYLVD